MIRIFRVSSLLAACLFAQEDRASLPAPSGVAYGPVRPEIRVAPGQVTQFQFSGIRLLDGDTPGGSSIIVKEFPAPTEINGVSVWLSVGGVQGPQGIFAGSNLGD